MTVKRVLYWKQSQESLVSIHTLNEISERIKNFNAVKERTWKTALSYFAPNLRDQSKRAEFPGVFLGMSLMGQPNQYYFVILDHKLVVEADSSILTIMDKLQSYDYAVTQNFEGLQYNLGDFQLKLIKVLNHTKHLRGIIMEIEYLPISSVETAKPIFEEFIEMWQEMLVKKSLPGKFRLAEPTFAEYGLSDSYTWQHTALQYAFAVTRLIESKLFRS